VAHKVLAVLAAPFHIGEHELFVTASIGVACYPDNGQDVDELLRNADAAMYRAKSGGRNSSSVFASGLNERAYEVLMLTNALRHAIARDELALHYQLRCDLASGEICGAEALARWRHPTMGDIPPGKFIPLAEEAGLIGEIGMWVMRTACRQMKAWQSAGIGISRVAVNLSARQFRDPGLIDSVASVLRDCGLEAPALELEVTESVMMSDPDAAARTLQQLHAMGVCISIDDFGTGYSSLSYLKRFPISYLKIDRSFIAGLPDASDDVAIVRAIIALARTLKLGIIGEGVETVEQRNFLRECGCNEAQGYLFGKPVPPDELERLVRGTPHGRGTVVMLPKRGAA
jgi:EAL domain-containing protein (putative c-di-GMP-specific phosphodiesterase class I)